MAKRQASRRGTTRRAGGSGQTLGGLAVVAAVLAGGTYLYRHTGGLPSDPAESPPVRQLPTRPSPLRHDPDAIPPAASKPAPSTPAIAASQAPSMASPSLTGPPQAATPGRVPVAPFGTSEEVFESGARLYAANCAGCHGRPGKNGKGPLAAQFWDHTNPAGTQAIAQSAGTLYQATAHGNLVQGMPSYAQRLTDTQLWDLALLMKSAHDDLPEPVTRLLRGQQ